MKILVLTTHRTGSANYCKQLAEQHNIDNLDEYLSETVHPAMRVKRLDSLENSDNWLVKLTPTNDKCADIDNVRPNPLLTLLKHADKVICLFRQDLNAQVTSYWITKMCNQLNSNMGIQVPDLHDEFDTPFDFNSIDKPHYTYIHKGDEITVSRDWCDIIALSLPRYRKFLFDEIRWIKLACQDLDVETVYTEEITKGTQYNRPFVLPKSFPKLATGYTLDRSTVTE